MLYKVGVVREDLLPNNEIEKAIKQEFGSNPIEFTTKLEIMRIIEKSDEDVLLLCLLHFLFSSTILSIFFSFFF